jgi:hypothetical protein
MWHGCQARSRAHVEAVVSSLVTMHGQVARGCIQQIPKHPVQVQPMAATVRGGQPPAAAFGHLLQLRSGIGSLVAGSVLYNRLAGDLVCTTSPGKAPESRLPNAGRGEWGLKVLSFRCSVVSAPRRVGMGVLLAGYVRPVDTLSARVCCRCAVLDSRPFNDSQRRRRTSINQPIRCTLSFLKCCCMRMVL